MVGINVGARLVARARHATFVSCGLAAAAFEFLGICVALSGGWVSRLFSRVPEVIVAGTGYFRAIGLVYGFMAASVVLFPAYQGWGIAAATALGAAVLGITFVLWPPIWSRKPVSG